METITLLGILILFMFIAILPGYIAYKKNRSVIGWYLLCCIFPIAFLFLLLVDPVDKRKRIPCKQCGELIVQDAVICPYCKEEQRN